MEQIIRDDSLDRIRVCIIGLVIFHHAAMGYAGFANWYYHEVPLPSPLVNLFLTSFCLINQSYFMGLLFLISGYFTTDSLQRKGYFKFLVDRGKRLGLPLLFFIYVLGPVTLWIGKEDPRPFYSIFFNHQKSNLFVTGPLWFTQVLLILTLAYCGFTFFKRKYHYQSPRIDRRTYPLPSPRAWFWSALGVGFFSFILRNFTSIGQGPHGLPIGFFASYIFFFSIGVVGGKNNWFNQLSWSRIRPWLWVSSISIPIIPLILALRDFYHFRIFTMLGGTPILLLHSFWESFVAWGMISGILLWFHTHTKGPSRVWSYLSRHSYLVFIIHPLILVSISVGLKSWQAHALIKFVTAGSLTCIFSWIVAGPVAWIPGVRRVV